MDLRFKMIYEKLVGAKLYDLELDPNVEYMLAGVHWKYGVLNKPLRKYICSLFGLSFRNR